MVLIGVRNPRSFEPSGIFKMRSFDTDGRSIIDEGLYVGTRTTEQFNGEPGDLDLTKVEPESRINGNITTYHFSG
jgi:hypothetical protein